MYLGDFSLDVVWRMSFFLVLQNVSHACAAANKRVEILFSVSAIKMKLFIIEFCPGFEPKDVPERVI